MMITCPLCGFAYDETALTCLAACPIAAVHGCNLLCCPNCGYQMVDERKSGLARLLRRTLKAMKSSKAHSREVVHE